MKFRIFLIVIALIICCNDSDSNEKEYQKTNLVNSNINSARDNSKIIDKRKEDLERAYEITQQFKDEYSKINQLQIIAREFYELGDHNRYKQIHERALKFFKSIPDSLEMAKTYSQLGIFHRHKQPDSAYKNFYEADKIYTSIENQKKYDPEDYAFRHGKVLLDLAKLRQRVKDYTESEYLSIKALEKFEISGNRSYIPLAYRNLGVVAKYTGRHKDAVSYHLKVIESSRNTEKDTLYATLSYNNIGTVYKAMGNYKEAEKYYNKALSYKNFLSIRPKRYARLLDNLAYVKFLANHEDEDAYNLFMESFKIRDSLNDRVGLSTVNLHLAEFYKSKDEDTIAKSYAFKAKELSSKENNMSELLESYRLISEVSKSNEGLAYANRYIKLNDSLVQEERLFKDKFARIKFETDQIAEQNLKISRENEQISRENDILFVVVVSITVLFVMIYVIVKQKQHNKELLFAQEQQETNQEIYRLLLNQQVKLEEGRQMEQQRMSEELHDGVLSRLFGVRLSLDGLNQRANDGFTDARTKYIEELKSIEKEIRLISHDLGTETLSPDIAYIESVESLISDLCVAHKMDFDFVNDENIDWEEIDDEKKVNLIRILQESLQNIFKHAKATSVKINFKYIDNNIKLIITDNGIGFKSTKVKRGIGLKNITSRVSQMSGVVDFISNQGSGTKVSVSIPV